ncbi:MAG: winged helix-turn-helix domain-containing protein [Halobacteria archaeon]|nr:winged helix-turn-helix domain-containing protein [Halobacteria archaeon]
MGDDERPGRNPSVTDDEILEIFEESDDPVLVASEIAEQLPIGRRAVHKRLKDLEDNGVLESKKVGGRSTVWWYIGHTDTP